MDGTVSPSCFCGVEVDRELEFRHLIEGDLSRVCAVQDGVSGFELEVVKMLQGYVIEAVKLPLWDRWQASPATSARCRRGKIFRLSFNADYQGGAR